MYDESILLYGGSFNPPHIGHCLTLAWALSTGRANRALMIPCYSHPLNKDNVAFEYRFEMCRRMAMGFRQGTVVISDVEKVIGGNGYTIDTIKHLQAKYPTKKFILMVGSDIMHEKDKWHKFDEIEKIVDILVTEREGYPYDKGAPLIVSTSSTNIRSMLEARKDASSLIDHRVMDYIVSNNLYGTDGRGE